MTIINESMGYSMPSGDRGDCAVRALAIATGRPYDECNALYAKHGRKPNHGTPRYVTISVHRAIGSLDVRVLHLGRLGQRLVKPARPRYDGLDPRGAYPTRAQFVKKNPKGRYVLLSRGHACALVDGVIHDWASRTSGARTRVLQALLITEEMP